MITNTFYVVTWDKDGMNRCDREIRTDMSPEVVWMAYAKDMPGCRVRVSAPTKDDDLYLIDGRFMPP